VYGCYQFHVTSIVWIQYGVDQKEPTNGNPGHTRDKMLISVFLMLANLVEILVGHTEYDL
jgi:hypothetical protein